LRLFWNYERNTAKERKVSRKSSAQYRSISDCEVYIFHDFALEILLKAAIMEYISYFQLKISDGSCFIFMFTAEWNDDDDDDDDTFLSSTLKNVAMRVNMFTAEWNDDDDYTFLTLYAKEYGDESLYIYSWNKRSWQFIIEF
jgi:hypothetical protein